jgi:hypothetical protein
MTVAAVCGGADAGVESCPHRPVPVTIDVLRMPSHRRIASTRTSPTGFFRMVLTPGDYELQAAGGLLWARPVAVHVVSQRFARVTVRLIPRHPLPVGAPS